MAELLIAYDPNKPEGQRLAAEVRAEVALLSTDGVIPNRSVGDDQLDDRSVTDRSLGDRAVDTRSIRDGAVGTDQLATRGVTGAVLATNAIRGEHIEPGGGVPTAHDGNGNPIDLNFLPITSADYAALIGAGTTIPTTVYLIRE